LLKKPKDLRVEILSYLNEKNETEYYPSCGFPIEVFVINENTLINLFTKENLNSSNFFFLAEAKYTTDLAITLKKLIFIGSYALYDHFSWNFYNEIPFYKNSFIKSITKSFFITTSTTYLSYFLDIKIFQLQAMSKSKKIQSVSRVYSNAVWLERENSEMFNIFYNSLIDSRRLLLDYSTPRGVLDKSNNNTQYSYFYKNYLGVNFI